jgi:catalase-peroxidase
MSMQKRTFTLLTSAALAMASVVGAGPVAAQEKAVSNQFWWQNLLDLKPLRQNAVESNPFGEKFDYP